MNNLKTQLKRMQHQIGQTESLTRYRYQPQLDRLIAQAERQGETIPTEVRRLNDVLLSEAIEAQFDNMPV